MGAIDHHLTADELYTAIESAERESASAETQHGHCIAFVFTHPIVADDGHVFFGPLVRAARSRATTLGCDVLVCAPSQDHWLEAELVERCVEHGANGLVVLGGADGNPDILRSRWPGLPVVFVEYDTVGSRSAHVGIDNETAMGEIVLHLAETGHSRIAHITGMLDSRVGAERMIAYRATMERLGYEIRPDYVQTGDFQLLSAYESAKRLLALDDPPDAIACAADVAAVGAIKAIQEAGLRVPEDIAVTGFDDAEWAGQLTPTLTTVRQPAKEMGRAAIESVVAMVEDPALHPPSVLLPGELVVRESCGAKPADVLAGNR
ncbi:MAG: LacI family transcriptional regulator [Gaiellaceae bacterium]|nr:LacI family transcriptional regulator [Gaiellaceae bacterium]